MARRPREPERRRADLSPAQLRRGIQLFRRRIDELRAFDVGSLEERSDPRVEALEASLDTALTAVYGPDTIEYKRYVRIRHLDTASIYLGRPTPIEEVREGLVRGITQAIALLEQAVSSMEEQLEEYGEQEVEEVVEAESAEISRTVFIVHGHDDGAKNAVARLIDQLRLQPVILQEQSDAGRTIIEKFEEHARDIGFAVVIITPDDVGGRRPERGEEPDLRPRTRQNVILELGFFAGALGRGRVRALKKGDVEIPSDFSGVLYIDMDEVGAWKYHLAREIRAAGIDVDANLIT